jgi:hypothetical protein
MAEFRPFFVPFISIPRDTHAKVIHKPQSERADESSMVYSFILFGTTMEMDTEDDTETRNNIGRTILSIAAALDKDKTTRAVVFVESRYADDAALHSLVEDCRSRGTPIVLSQQSTREHRESLRTHTNVVLLRAGAKLDTSFFTESTAAALPRVHAGGVRYEGGRSTPCCIFSCSKPSVSFEEAGTDCVCILAKPANIDLPVDATCVQVHTVVKRILHIRSDEPSVGEIIDSCIQYIDEQTSKTRAIDVLGNSFPHLPCFYDSPLLLC